MSGQDSQVPNTQNRFLFPGSHRTAANASPRLCSHPELRVSSQLMWLLTEFSSFQESDGGLLLLETITFPATWPLSVWSGCYKKCSYLGGLKTTERYFSQFKRLGSPGEGTSIFVSGESLLPVSRMATVFPRGPHMVGGARHFSGVSL